MSSAENAPAASSEPAVSAAIPSPDVRLPPPSVPEAPLYSPNQIIVGALLGTPIAAAVMWRANLVALGRPRPWLALAAGFAATGVLVAVNVAVTSNLGFVPVVLAIALRQPASLAFTPQLVAAGGRRSWARAIGVTFATTVAFLLAMCLGVLASSGIGAFAPPEVRTATNEVVQFDDEADRAHAEQLAHALVEIGVFDGTGKNAVSMDKPSGDGGFGVAVHFPSSVSSAARQQWVDFVASEASRVLHQCVRARTVDDGAFDPKTLEEKRVCP